MYVNELGRHLTKYTYLCLSILHRFPGKASLCFHLEVQKKAPVTQNMEWINFKAIADVMFAQSDLAQVNANVVKVSSLG